MLDKNDLQAIAGLIRNEIEPVNKRLDNLDAKVDNIDQRLTKVEKNITSMKKDIKLIKEDAKVTRVCTNELVKWVDYNFHDERPFPVDDETEEILASLSVK